ncbi:hypothetical protein B296_00006905, partial [Ensete ventricosum]
WLSKESALMLLQAVKASATRVGPYVFMGLVPDVAKATNFSATCTLHYQIILLNHLLSGLSVIQKCNPDAVLLAHENTSRHIGRGNNFVSILALLKQGSAVMDVRAGGNLKVFIFLCLNVLDVQDYFQTTYRFLDLSPHVLIPMHGRINLWPKQMLCGYLKYDTATNKVLFIRTLTSPFALVMQDFSIQNFQASCRSHFLCRWLWTYLKCRGIVKAIGVIGVASFAIAFAVKEKFGG